MTNLNTANLGMNKYCGPAVLSILTGKSTDECARVISSVNGQYRIEGVELRHLLKAAEKLGFDNKPLAIDGSLYGTLVRLVSFGDGMYIVSVPNHFVAIEVNQKKIYFCDNHTKEPISAAASARLLQRVMAVNQVFKRPEVVVIPPPKPKPEPELTNPKIYSYKQAIERINLILTMPIEHKEKLIRIETAISMINEERYG
jgi:hypothetical protein